MEKYPLLYHIVLDLIEQSLGRTEWAEPNLSKGGEHKSLIQADQLVWDDQETSKQPMVRRAKGLDWIRSDPFGCLGHVGAAWIPSGIAWPHESRLRGQTESSCMTSYGKTVVSDIVQAQARPNLLGAKLTSL